MIRAHVNVKQAGVQTPVSSVFVVWNDRGFDFWRTNRRTFLASLFTVIQQSNFHILHEHSSYSSCYELGLYMPILAHFI